MTRVGFQGISGAYSEMAAQQFFEEPDYTIVPIPSFSEVFALVESRKLDYGVIPLENSLAGSIHENYDHLRNHSVWIWGETYLRVKHSLLGVKGTSLKKVEDVYSHPQALSQCERFLSDSGYNVAPYFDTAGSAKYVAEQQDKSIAAIASRHAAIKYGLTVLKSSIEDDQLNFTRFAVIRPRLKRGSYSLDLKKGNKYKTSIVFALKNVPGCLHKCLSVFAIREIDLTKIESRPLKGSPWKYLFYLDIEGAVTEPRIIKTLEHLKEITESLQVLGSYITSNSN